MKIRELPEIGQLSGDITPKVGDRVEWLSPMLGRFALKNLQLESTQVKGPFFELNAVRRMDPETQTYPTKRFIFTGRGKLLGVLRARISESDWEEDVKDSMEFQLRHGLTFPVEGEELELLEYLDSYETRPT